MTTLKPSIRAAFAAASAGGLMTGCVGMSGCDSSRYTTRQAQTVTIAAERVFTLDNRVGDVTIVSDPAATAVTCELVKVGKGSTQANADQALSEIRVDTSDGPGDSDAKARAATPDGSGWTGRQWEVKWTVTAPPGTKIIVVNKVGDVKVRGFAAGAEITSGVGDVDVTEVTGGVSVTGNVGDVTISGDGALSAASDVGDVRVTALGGSARDITAKSNVGDVVVTLPPAWSGRVSAGTGVGKVTSSLAGLSERPAGKRYGSGSSVEGVIGAGDGGEAGSVTVSANVGDISLSKAR